MKPGDIITMGGVSLEVVSCTTEPAPFVLRGAKPGEPLTTSCQFATVREIRKPTSPGARDRR